MNMIHRLHASLDKCGQLEQSLPQQVCSIQAFSNHSNYILVIDSDIDFFHALRSLTTNKDIYFHLVTTAKDALRLLKVWQPSVIVVDIHCARTEAEELLLLDELCQIEPSIPIITLVPQLDFQQRIRLSKPGIQRILRKPILPVELIDTVSSIIYRTNFQDDVLVLSKDTELLGHLDQILKPRGLPTQLIDDSFIFWSILERSKPSLLLIDLDNSVIDAFNLCRAIRYDSAWRDLPIVILSEQADRSTLQKVFAAGADDYVQKPIFEPELIARVFNRLERSRLIHELADTDSLTRLSNRRKATTDIERLISIAERQDRSLCFVIFDVDHFKTINDQHGHWVGDQALRNTGLALKQTFRQSDVIARWGGDEFVLGLFDLTVEQCARRMKELMTGLRCQTFDDGYNHATFPLSLSITYSVGIAGYPMDGYTLEALYQSADQALYAAKKNGRNQIYLAEQENYSEHQGLMPKC